ncbi:MAG: inositol monophosphatase family protein [Microcoleaceae cyanobacterium]
MDHFWKTVLNFTQTTTATIGDQLLKDFGSAIAHQKADGTLITQSDEWSDRYLRQQIRQTFPSHGILSEEGEHRLPVRDWCWIIDPIDGTTNFARGIPLWGICLALLYQGTPVFGYVHLPPLNQSFHGFWYGSSGLTGPTGAFLNQQPIFPTQQPPDHNQFIGLGSRCITMAPRLPTKVRVMGMAAYNFLLVAWGSSVAGIEPSPKIWDIAAPWVIVQASGAVWHSLESQPIFPLKIQQDYGNRPYPTLVVNRPEWVSKFLPLIDFGG